MKEAAITKTAEDLGFAKLLKNSKDAPITGKVMTENGKLPL